MEKNMAISGVGGSSAYQMYQLSAQKMSGQATKQTQQPQPQGASEENRESSVAKSREASSGGESKETRSINTYA
jgi:hypothetical protein